MNKNVHDYSELRKTIKAEISAEVFDATKEGIVGGIKKAVEEKFKAEAAKANIDASQLSEKVAETVQTAITEGIGKKQVRGIDLAEIVELNSKDLVQEIQRMWEQGEDTTKKGAQKMLAAMALANEKGIKSTQIGEALDKHENEFEEYYKDLLKATRMSKKDVEEFNKDIVNSLTDFDIKLDSAVEAILRDTKALDKGLGSSLKDAVKEFNDSIQALNDADFDKIYRDTKKLDEMTQRVAEGLTTPQKAIQALLEQGEDLAELGKLFELALNKFSETGGKKNDMISFWQQMSSQIKEDDSALKDLLETLGLLRDDDTLSAITSGANNLGGLIGARNLVKLRKITEGTQYSAPVNYENLKELKDMLDQAADAGANVARILGIVDDEEKGVLMTLEEALPGKDVENLADGLPFNPEFLKASDKAIIKLIADLKYLYDIGAGLDIRSGNLKYDAEKDEFFIFDIDTKSIHKNFDEVMEELREFLDDQAYELNEAGDTLNSNLVNGFIGQLSKVYSSIDIENLKLSDLKKSVEGVTDAVKEKTEAFQDEGKKVVKAAEDESKKVEKAAEKVEKAAEKMSASTGKLKDAAHDSAQKTQDSHSDAKETKPLGEDFAGGMASGIEAGQERVEEAAANLVKGAIEATDEAVDEANKKAEKIWAEGTGPDTKTFKNALSYAKRRIKKNMPFGDLIESTREQYLLNNDEVELLTEKMKEYSKEHDYYKELWKEWNKTGESENGGQTQSLTEASQDIAEDTEEVAENVEEVSENTEKISENIEEASNSAEELKENLNETKTEEVVENTEEISENLSEAADSAEEVKEKLNDTNADNLSKSTGTVAENLQTSANSAKEINEELNNTNANNLSKPLKEGAEASAEIRDNVQKTGEELKKLNENSSVPSVPTNETPSEEQKNKNPGMDENKFWKFNTPSTEASSITRIIRDTFGLKPDKVTKETEKARLKLVDEIEKVILAEIKNEAVNYKEVASVFAPENKDLSEKIEEKIRKYVGTYLNKYNTLNDEQKERLIIKNEELKEYMRKKGKRTSSSTPEQNQPAPEVSQEEAEVQNNIEEKKEEIIEDGEKIVEIEEEIVEELTEEEQEQRKINGIYEGRLRARERELQLEQEYNDLLAEREDLRRKQSFYESQIEKSFSEEEQQEIKGKYEDALNQARNNNKTVDSIIDRINKKNEKVFNGSDLDKAKKAATMMALFERYKELAGEDFSPDKIIGGQKTIDYYAGLYNMSQEKNGAAGLLSKVNQRLIELEGREAELKSGHPLFEIEKEIKAIVKAVNESGRAISGRRKSKLLNLINEYEDKGGNPFISQAYSNNTLFTANLDEIFAREYTREDVAEQFRILSDEQKEEARKNRVNNFMENFRKKKAEEAASGISSTAGITSEEIKDNVIATADETAEEVTEKAGESAKEIKEKFLASFNTVDFFKDITSKQVKEWADKELTLPEKKANKVKRESAKIAREVNEALRVLPYDTSTGKFIISDVIGADYATSRIKDVLRKRNILGQSKIFMKGLLGDAFVEAVEDADKTIDKYLKGEDKDAIHNEELVNRLRLMGWWASGNKTENTPQSELWKAVHQDTLMTKDDWDRISGREWLNFHRTIAELEALEAEELKKQAEAEAEVIEAEEKINEKIEEKNTLEKESAAAGEKVVRATSSMTSSLTETLGEKAAAFEEERAIVDSVIDAEVSKIKELENAVDAVTSAVKRKTSAFEEEEQTVNALISAEATATNLKIGDKLQQLQSVSSNPFVNTGIQDILKSFIIGCLSNQFVKPFIDLLRNAFRNNVLFPQTTNYREIESSEESLPKVFLTTDYDDDGIASDVRNISKNISTVTDDIKTISGYLENIQEDTSGIRESSSKTSVGTSNELSRAIKGWVEASNIMSKVAADDLNQKDIYGNARRDRTQDRERFAYGSVETGQISNPYVTSNKDEVSDEISELVKGISGYLTNKISIHSHPEDYIVPSGGEGDLNEYLMAGLQKGLIIGRKQMMLIDPSVLEEDVYNDIIDSFDDIIASKDLQADMFDEYGDEIDSEVNKLRPTFEDVKDDYGSFYKELSKLITVILNIPKTEHAGFADKLKRIINEKGLNFAFDDADSITKFVKDIFTAVGKPDMYVEGVVGSSVFDFNNPALKKYKDEFNHNAGIIAAQFALKKAFEENAPEDIKYSDFVKTLNYENPATLTEATINDFLGIQNTETTYLEDISNNLKQIVGLLTSSKISLSGGSELSNGKGHKNPRITSMAYNLVDEYADFEEAVNDEMDIFLGEIFREKLRNIKSIIEKDRQSHLDAIEHADRYPGLSKELLVPDDEKYKELFSIDESKMTLELGEVYRNKLIKIFDYLENERSIPLSEAKKRRYGGLKNSSDRAFIEQEVERLRAEGKWTEKDDEDVKSGKLGNYEWVNPKYLIEHEVERLKAEGKWTEEDDEDIRSGRIRNYDLIKPDSQNNESTAINILTQIQEDTSDIRANVAKENVPSNELAKTLKGWVEASNIMSKVVDEQLDFGALSDRSNISLDRERKAYADPETGLIYNGFVVGSKGEIQGALTRELKKIIGGEKGLDIHSHPDDYIAPSFWNGDLGSFAGGKQSLIVGRKQMMLMNSGMLTSEQMEKFAKDYESKAREYASDKKIRSQIMSEISDNFASMFDTPEGRKYQNLVIDKFAKEINEIQSFTLSRDLTPEERVDAKTIKEIISLNNLDFTIGDEYSAKEFAKKIIDNLTLFLPDNEPDFVKDEFVDDVADSIAKNISGRKLANKSGVELKYKDEVKLRRDTDIKIGQKALEDAYKATVGDNFSDFVKYLNYENPDNLSIAAINEFLGIANNENAYVQDIASNVRKILGLLNENNISGVTISRGDDDNYFDERTFNPYSTPGSSNYWRTDYINDKLVRDIGHSTIFDEDLLKFKNDVEQGEMSDLEYAKKFFDEYEDAIRIATENADDSVKKAWQEYGRYVKNQRKETIGELEEEIKQEKVREKVLEEESKIRIKLRNMQEKDLENKTISYYQRKQTLTGYISNTESLLGDKNFTDAETRAEAERLLADMEAMKENAQATKLEFEIIKLRIKEINAEAQKNIAENKEIARQVKEQEEADKEREKVLQEEQKIRLKMQKLEEAAANKDAAKATHDYVEDKTNKKSVMGIGTRMDALLRNENLKDGPRQLVSDVVELTNKMLTMAQITKEQMADILLIEADVTREARANIAANEEIARQNKQQEKEDKNELARKEELSNIVSDIEKMLNSSDYTIDFKSGELNDFYEKIKGIQQQTSLTVDDLKAVKKELEDINSDAAESKKEQTALNNLAKKYGDILTKKNNDGNHYYTREYLDQIEKALSMAREGTLSVDEGKALLSGISNPDYIVGSQKTLKNYIIKGQKLITQSYMPGNLKKQFEEIVDAMQIMVNEGGHSRTEISRMISSFQDLEAEAAKVGKTLIGQVAQRLQDMNAKFIATYFSFHDIVRYGKTVINTITELDTALTEMRKVSDESVKSLKAYQKTTFDTASALGTTAVQLQQSTADWLRLGESMEEASKSAVTATTLMNVSEFDSIDKATEALVSMSQAYKDLDKTEIIDVMNNIGNNYAIATDELATALQASASALVTQGNDLYEATALVTAGNAVIQDASKVGTGIRTISLRIAGIKEGDDDVKKELEELGEEVDEWVVSTQAKKRKVIMDYTKVASNKGQGVDILDSNGNLKDTYEIMLEIAKIYKEIQEEDKKYGTNRAQGLVEELAGKIRSNIAASILMNPELLEDVYTSAQNSTGSAAEENAKYLDSIVGKTQQFKNELQELESNVLDSELIKDVIDLGTGVLSIINKLDKALPPLIALIGAITLGVQNANREWVKFIEINTKGVGQNFLKDNGLFSKIASNVLGIGVKNYGINFNEDLYKEMKKIFDFNGLINNTIKEGDNVDLSGVVKKFLTGFDTIDDTIADNILEGDGFAKFQKSISEGLDVSDSINEFISNTDELKDAISEDAQELLGQGVDSLKEYTTAQIGVTEATEEATGAVSAFNGIAGALTSFGIMLTVTLLTWAAKQLWTYTERIEEAAQEASRAIKDLNEELKDNKKFIDENAEEFVKLGKEVDDLGNNVGLSNDEFDRYNELANEIADRFPLMVDGWTSEGNAIIGVRDNLEALNKEYDEYRKMELGEILDSKNFEDISKQFEVFMNPSKLVKGVNIIKSLFTGNFDKLTSTAGMVKSYNETQEYLEAYQNMSYEDFIKKINEDPTYAHSVDLLSNKSIIGFIDTLAGTNVLMRGAREKLKEKTGIDFTVDTPLTWGIKLDEESGKIKWDISISEDDYKKMQRDWELQALENERKIQEIASDFKTYVKADIEYELIGNDEQLDEETLKIANKIVDSLDNEFAYALSQDQSLTEEFSRQIVDILGSEEFSKDETKEYLETLFGIKSDDRTYQEVVDDLFVAYAKIEKEFNDKIKNSKTKTEADNYEAMLNSIRVASGYDEFMALDDEFQKSLTKFYGNASEEEKKALAELTENFSAANMQLWLEATRGITNVTQAIRKYREELRKAAKDTKYVNIGALLSQDTFLNEGSQLRYEHLQSLYSDAVAKGDQEKVKELEKEMNELYDREESWFDVREDLIEMSQTGTLDEDTLKNYKYFDEILKQLGTDAENSEDAIKEIIKTIEKMASNETLNELDAFKQGIDHLDSAYQQYKKGKLIDASSLKDIQSVFGNLDSFDKFQNAVMTGEKNLQPYFNELASEYAKQKISFDDLSESTRGWYEQNLVAAGITKKSAKEVVDSVLQGKIALESSARTGLEELNKSVVSASDGYKKYALSAEDMNELTAEQVLTLIKLNDEIERQRESEDGLVQLTDKEIDELKTEGIVLGDTAQAVVLFVLKKELSKDLSMRNEDDINYLLQLINLAGLGGEAIEGIQGKMKNYNAYVGKIGSLEKRINKLLNGRSVSELSSREKQQFHRWNSQLNGYYKVVKEVNDFNNDMTDKVDEAMNIDYSTIYGGAVDSASSAAEDAYQKFKELIEKLLALYDAELAAGTITFQEYVEKSRRLIEEYYNSGKIKAADYYGYLESLAEKQKAQYDKVISAVQKLIQKQIKELEKQKEAIEENYNEQIEAIQEKIDAIQDENEEIDKNMALQKAQ